MIRKTGDPCLPPLSGSLTSNANDSYLRSFSFDLEFLSPA